MKNLILISIIVTLMLTGCSESITGPDWNIPDTPIINYPKDNIHISVEAEKDTIIADWEEIENCSRYYAIIHYDSIEVARPDSVSIFANEWHTAPANSVGMRTQQVFINGNKKMLIVYDGNFKYLGDTIKVFWKIKAEDDTIRGLFSDWSNIESFYVVNAEI